MGAQCVLGTCLKTATKEFLFPMESKTYEPKIFPALALMQIGAHGAEI
jgi:hypothetical protein